MDSDGRKTNINADKRAMIIKTGLSIPIRDMRLLDFNLVQCDSTILVRENAIIASLEHARVIIMSDKAIIPKEGVEHNALAARFLDVLEESIHEWLKHKKEYEEQLELGTPYVNQTKPKMTTWDGYQVHPFEHTTDQEDTSSGMVSQYYTKREARELMFATSVLGAVSTLQQDLQPLPFELVVLEAALKEVVASMNIQISEVEGVSVPALDSLMQSVSPTNLERVRKVKTKLQRLTLRCEALRDELQRFLQDDDDMSKMCLTRHKEVEEELVRSTTQMLETSEIPNERPSLQVSTSYRRSYVGRLGHSPMQNPVSQGGISTSMAQEEDVEADAEAHLEVENLLESYYMQVDGMYDKLVSIGEYIKDTEEYINIGTIMS